MLSSNRLGHYASITATVATLFTLNACTTVHTPAPVVALNTTAPASNVLNEISGDSYQVQSGDTLFAIAFYSGNDYRELAKLNNIIAPYTLKPGQTIRITRTPNANKTNNTNKINAITKTTRDYTKVPVDPSSSAEYGGSKDKKQRTKHSPNKRNSKNSSNALTWIWPASGQATSAIVGSDGSIRGIDIKGNLGASVVAATNGKVVYAGNALKGYGNLVIIKHDNDYLSAYAHNDSILVSEQMYVTRGQKIATMGQSGTNEVRLHFEIREKGKSLDPLKFLPEQNKD